MPTIFVKFRTSGEPFAAVRIDETRAARFGPDAVIRDARSIQLGEEFIEKSPWWRVIDAVRMPDQGGPVPLLRLTRDRVDPDRLGVTAAARSALDDREDSDGLR